MAGRAKTPRAHADLLWGPSDTVWGPFLSSFPTGHEQQLPDGSLRGLEECGPDQFRPVAWMPMVHGQQPPEQNNGHLPFMEDPREKEVVAPRRWPRKTELLGTAKQDLRKEALKPDFMDLNLTLALPFTWCILARVTSPFYMSTSLSVRWAAVKCTCLKALSWSLNQAILEQYLHGKAGRGGSSPIRKSPPDRVGALI